MPVWPAASSWPGSDHPMRDDAVGRRADLALARDDLRLPQLRLRAIDFRARLRRLPPAEPFARERQLLFADADGGLRAIELGLRAVVVALARRPASRAATPAAALAVARSTAARRSATSASAAATSAWRLPTARSCSRARADSTPCRSRSTASAVSPRSS